MSHGPKEALHGVRVTVCGKPSGAMITCGVEGGGGQTIEFLDKGLVGLVEPVRRAEHPVYILENPTALAETG